MKLKYLLTIAFIILTSIPLFLSLEYLNTKAGNYTRELNINYLTALSQIAKTRITNAMYRVKDNTALISSRTQMRISLSLWNETADKAHQEKVTRIINDAKNGLIHLKSISVFDVHGKQVGTTDHFINKTIIDVTAIDRTHITLQQENDDVVVVSLAPLTLNNQTVGYIRVTYYSDFITELISDRSGLGKTGEWLFAVRDDSGDALFAIPLKYDHKAAFKKRIAKERTDIPITQAMLGNEIIMQQAPDYRNTPVLASTRYLPEFDWGLVAKIDEAEINALIKENKTAIYIAEFVIVLIAIFTGIGLAMFIARPIESLSDHVSKVGHGHLEDPPDTYGWHEVKQLNTHFKHMIKELREFNTQLQTKVDNQTQALQDANKQLEHLATIDPLTQLFNRRKLDEILAYEFSRAKRYQLPLTIAMLDIDHFKSVNDNYGHAVGDHVLKQTASLLKKTVRTSDIVARFGGEEFCLVLQSCPAETATAFLDRIRLEIASLSFTAEGIEFSITSSFGFAALSEETLTAETLVNQADEALYQAKASGRNKVVQFKV
ncbi:sensor domain-containing diguanylate cyclase [Thalassotalea fusca]